MPGNVVLLSNHPWLMGQNAYRLGQDITDNPWPLLSKNNEQWDDGWLDALVEDGEPAR